MELLRSSLTRLLLVVVGTVALFHGPAAGLRKGAPKPLPAVVQGLQPSGLRISLLDDEGVDLVIINANINVPLEVKEGGKINKAVPRAQNGFWTLHAPDEQLKPNDVVFYWVFYSVRGESQYIKGHQLISELVEPSCLPSITTANGRPTCKGSLVFEDNFDSLNNSVWSPIIQFSDGFNAFNAYVPFKENLFAEGGSLHMKPTVLKDEEELMSPQKLEGCTSRWIDQCDRKPFAWNILPPTRAAWISTGHAFAFRFGRIEVRAKPAAGDWLASWMFLDSRDFEYGSGGFESGRLELLRVFGNADLRWPEGGENGGGKMNRVNAAVNTCGRTAYFLEHYYLPSGLLTDDFRTYTITWTPQHIKFELDGVLMKEIQPPRPGGFLDTDYYRDCNDSSWENGSFMAPFDKEFNLQFTLGVAGHHTFADGSTSGGYKKPYTDKSPRGALEFWRARDLWQPTWKGDFEVDYVKVWAL